VAEGRIIITLPGDLDPAIRRQVLDALPQGGVEIAAPDAAMAAPLPTEIVDAAIETAVAASGALPDALMAYAAQFGGVGGLLLALLTIAAAMAAGYAAERALRRPEPAHGATETETPFTDTLLRAGRWCAGRLVSLAIFIGVALVLARLLTPEAARPLADALIFATVLPRLMLAVVDLLAAPGAPRRRLAGLDDGDARMVTRLAAAALALNWAFRVVVVFLSHAAAGAPGALAVSALIFVGALPGVIYWFLVRRPVGGLILKAFGAADPAQAGPRLRFLARNWSFLYVGVSAMNALSGASGALGVPGAAQIGRSGGVTTLVAVLTPFIVAGIALWRDERRAVSDPARHAALLGGAALAKGVVIVAAMIFLLRAWGMDPFSPPPEGASGLILLLPALLKAAFAVVIGAALWRTASELIAAYAAPPPPDLSKPMGDEIGMGGSRLGTVLPVLRAFALTAISVMTAMFALSALGVNIAPLLAGAGVLGLALGFGAQRLVADVISGMFYLYEDAFRVGEYLETSQGKGIVERISFRSVRLRHPRGPVFTIPFSTMGTVQNHSRDYVKVKFVFEVPQHTDLERVRKLVKKVGESLLEDPELDGRFLEPMKSQGAVGIKGQAFLVGVKFVTRPGQQFLARRKAMAALQRAFEENDIELMTPRIEFGAAAGSADLAEMVARGGAPEAAR